MERLWKCRENEEQDFSTKIRTTKSVMKNHQSITNMAIRATPTTIPALMEIKFHHVCLG